MSLSNVKRSQNKEYLLHSCHFISRLSFEFRYATLVDLILLLEKNIFCVINVAMAENESCTLSPVKSKDYQVSESHLIICKQLNEDNNYSAIKLSKNITTSLQFT